MRMLETARRIIARAVLVMAANAQLFISLTSIVSALSMTYSPYQGPYKRIYPPVNISIDQESCSPDPALNRTCPLYIALIMSFGGAYNSSGAISAMEVALDQINSDPNMLPGYTLHYTLKDSQCDRTTALDALHTEMIQPPTKIAVIGSGCSLATEPTAEISHYYNLTQLSCVSSSPELTNRKRFPRHFQLEIDETRIAYGFFGAIQTFQWRKISIIVQNERLFTLPMFRLGELLTATNVTFTEMRFETDIGITSNPFQDTEDRIFILSMYAGHAREALCIAHSVNRRFRYPRNLFFMNGWYENQWWEGNEEEQADLLRKYNCSVSQRKSLLPFTLATSTVMVQDYSAVADNGYTGDEVQSAYEEYLYTSLPKIYFFLCYDGVWTLARALNETLTDLMNSPDFQERLRTYRDGRSTGNFGLQHFKYDNNVLLENIYTHLSETNFNGIIGNISFNANGSRELDTTEILQYRVGEGDVLRVVPVATVSRKSRLEFSFVYLSENESVSTLWREGVPYDGVPTEKTVSLHVFLTIIFSILATSGIIFAVVCMVLNTHFRDKKLIRLTSPKLNNLIGVGAMILYFNVYTFIVPTADQTAISVLCNLNPWLTAIGYSLCYGTILAKMCRVYYIFNNPLKRKKDAKDKILALFVLFLIFIDVLILFIYTVHQGTRGSLSANKVPSKENMEERIGAREEVIRYFIYICHSRERYITLGILYGYKALLQIVALVLAVSIRKVHIKGLNDAVYVISAIYVTSIVTTVIIVSTYTLTEFIHVYASVFCLCIFIGTTVILALVFIPPMIGIYRDPDGGVFKSSVQMDIQFNTKSRECLSEEPNAMIDLRNKITLLENKLQELSQREGPRSDQSEIMNTGGME